MPKKVKLKKGIKRHAVKTSEFSWSIVRDEEKECPDEVFEMCSGRLDEVKEKKEPETPYKVKSTFERPKKGDK